MSENRESDNTGNTIFNLPKRWIRDWKAADSKDQVSMIRDLLTIFGVPSVLIIVSGLKKFNNPDIMINAFLITCYIVYTLTTLLIYAIIPLAMFWLIIRFIKCRFIKGISISLLILLSLLLLYPYTQLTKSVFTNFLFD